MSIGPFLYGYGEEQKQTKKRLNAELYLIGLKKPHNNAGLFLYAYVDFVDVNTSVIERPIVVKME